MSTIPAVRRMVMFKHGVAYLERSGPADGPFEISFKKDEMNDVLKSLSVWVESGDARVGAIGFDKPEDPELALAERKLNLTAGAALSGLLGSFRGRRVAVEAGGLRHEGEVLGLEVERVKDGAERKLLALRTGDGSVALVDLSQAKSVDFPDDHSRADLAFLVERSRAATVGSSRSVRVGIAGKAEDLRLSYVIPAPVWRVCYRIVCEAAETMLMAWGIVHNPLDEDLSDLELTLTTGQPVSFTIDLYHPKNVKRVAIEETARVAAAPKGDVGAMLSLSDDLSGYEHATLGATRLSRAARQMAAASEFSDRGELFEYRVASRISLKRGGSAMVPLLATPIRGRRQRMWRVGAEPNPDLVLVFKNDTGAVLEQGAAVIYDDSVYAGEAMLPYSARGVDVNAIYARDLAVRCKHASETRALLSAIRLVPDAAVEEKRFEEHHELSAENDNKDEIEVVFELPKNHGRTFDPGHSQPETEVLDYSRFRLRVPPHGQASLKVVERWLGDQRFQYASFSAADLQRWLEGRFLDERTHKELGGVLAARDRIRALQQQIERATKEREGIQAKQKTLSEQLTVLKEGGREGELRLRYVGELEGEQDKANHLAEEIARFRAEAEALNKEGNERLRAVIGAPARGKWDWLVADGVLTADELALAARTAQKKALDMETVLADDFQVKQSALGQALAKFYGVAYEMFNPDRELPGGLLDKISPQYFDVNGWLPIGGTRAAPVILCTEPDRVPGIVKNVYPGSNPVYRVCTRLEFRMTLKQAFGEDA